MNGKNHVSTGIGVQTIQNGYLSASTLIAVKNASDDEPFDDVTDIAPVRLFDLLVPRFR